MTQLRARRGTPGGVGEASRIKPGPRPTDASAVPPPPDAIAALRAVLPWWAAYGSLLPFAVGALACGLLAPGLAIRWVSRPLRRLSADAPWTERARLAAPVQSVSGLGLVLPGAAFGMLAWTTHGPMTPVSRGTAFAIALLAGALGGVWSRWRAQRMVYGDRRSLGAALRSDGILVVLLLPQILLVSLLACAIRAPFDGADAFALVLALAGLAAAARWSGLPLLRAAGLSREAPASLRERIHGIADRLGIARPRVEVVAWPLANAFALPLCGTMGLTERLLEVLDDEEQAAIAAHEMGHLAEGPGQRACRFAAGFLLLPLGLAPAAAGVHGWPAFGVAIGAFLVAAVSLGRFARRMEERADRVAHGDEEAPGVYARALEKLYRANLSPAVGSKARAPHPHLYDRMRAAGLAPDYPRPAPPSRVRLLAGTGLQVALVMTCVIALLLGPILYTAHRGDAVAISIVTWTYGGAAPEAGLLSLAHALEDGGRRADAIAVARAAADLTPADPSAPAYESTLWSQAGRCDAAAERFREAAARAPALAGPAGRAVDPAGGVGTGAGVDPWLAAARSWLEVCRQRVTAATPG